MSEPKSPFKRVRRHFDFDDLKRICEMHETDFPSAYGMEVTATPSRSSWILDDKAEYEDFYAFLDRGSNILAVAHLDTVVKHSQRTAGLLDTAAGPVVYSGALDDRLGAYTILELLPRLGVNVDVLLTTGEEVGNSSAQHFTSDKEYHWVIEFDRGGTDVVMYQYEDGECVDLVEDSGARVGSGSFSDIAYLEQLEVKAFNWGVGYRDYHGPRGHVYLEDYWMMIGYFLKFHAVNVDNYLPHEERRATYGSRSTLWDGMGYGSGHGSRYLDECTGWCGAYNVTDLDPGTGLCPECLADLEEDDRNREAGASESGDEEVIDIPDSDTDLVSEEFHTVNNHLLALEGGH
jgi:hypothetical protein